MSKTLGSLSVGAKIEVPVLSAYQSRFGSKIVFKIADKNHSGYPSNSVTLITEKIIQNMASDAKEPSNSNSDRKNYTYPAFWGRFRNAERQHLGFFPTSGTQCPKLYPSVDPVLSPFRFELLPATLCMSWPVRRAASPGAGCWSPPS